MGALGFSKDTLSQMRLSQLRELARRIGVGRYSAMLRDQLIAALQGRVLRSDASDTNSSGVPVAAASSLGSVVSAQAPAVELTSAQNLATPTFSTWVDLLPRESQWATVRWAITPDDKDRALAAGGLQLALRLTDVTTARENGDRPHTLQEVVVDAGAREWHLPVPLGNRDYRVELGFRTATGWYSLAHSSVSWIPAEVELPIHPFAPFNLAPDAGGETPWPTPVSSPGLHERLYQQASAGRVRLGLGSEGFQDHNDRADLTAGGHLSGVGQWASGREASGAGMAPRQRSFWLVADAELIVYGATDPSATLRVGDQVTPLAEDGTFRFHTAFPDGDQNYPIRAIAADGEQNRSITIDFRRTTPEANVNAKEHAVPEWF